MNSKPGYLGRRDFLGGLASSATTMTLSPKYIAELLSQNNGRKLGVAMLGLGGYATNQLAPALRQTKLCQLTAVVTGPPEKGEKWATDYNLPKKNIYTYE